MFIILNMKQNDPFFFTKYLDMLFEIMLFLIKAEASTFERNSDPLEKWRVKIV